MTVDATKPLGTDLVSTLDDYIREGRVEINSLWSAVGSGISAPNYTAISMTASVPLVGGTDVDAAGVEVIGLSGTVAVMLSTITACSAGAIKVFVIQNDNVTFEQADGDVTGGTFQMNAPTDVDINVNTGDVIAFVNIGGDGVTADGYWMELWRKLQV